MCTRKAAKAIYFVTLKWSPYSGVCEAKFFSISLPCNLQRCGGDTLYRFSDLLSSRSHRGSQNLLKTDLAANKLIDCKICGMKFKKKSNLRVHVLKHRFSENFVTHMVYLTDITAKYVGSIFLQRPC
ncbi:uncharacterized protein [Parasteatoda tepidariorum]|uniref:uncharacterized protein n=1 Tax=Parasteatoda tepidariorum TaxID=114398 RepID=UPI0039BC3F79